MKKKLRVLSLVMALLMTLSLLPGAAFASEEPELTSGEEALVPVEEASAEAPEESAADAAEETPATVDEPEPEEPAAEEPVEAEILEEELPAEDGKIYTTVSSNIKTVGALYATFQVNISALPEEAADADDVTFYVLFREAGTTEWSFVGASPEKLTDRTATVSTGTWDITAPLTPGTSYEYKGVYCVYANSESLYARETSVHSFTTAAVSTLTALRLNEAATPAFEALTEYSFTAPADGFYKLISDGVDLCINPLRCSQRMNAGETVTFLAESYWEEATVKVISTSGTVTEPSFTVGTPKLEGTTATVDITGSVPAGYYGYVTYNRGEYYEEQPFNISWSTDFAGECKDEAGTVWFENLFPGYTYNYSLTMYVYEYNGDSDTITLTPVTGSITVPADTAVPSVSLGNTTLTGEGVLCFTAPEADTYTFSLSDYSGKLLFGQNGTVTSCYGYESATSSFSLKAGEKLYIGYNAYSYSEDGEDSVLTITKGAKKEEAESAASTIDDIYIDRDTLYVEYTAGSNPEGNISLYARSGEDGYDRTYITNFYLSGSVESGSQVFKAKIGNLLIPGQKYTVSANLYTSYAEDATTLTFTAPERTLPTITAGQEVEVDENTVYKFVPDESGRYSVLPSSANINIFDTDGNTVSQSDGKDEDSTLYAQLEAGKTYYVSAMSGIRPFSIKKTSGQPSNPVANDAIHSITADVYESRNMIRVKVEYSLTADSTTEFIEVKLGNITRRCWLDSGETDHGTEYASFNLVTCPPGKSYALSAEMKDGEWESTGVSLSGESFTPSYTFDAVTEGQPFTTSGGTFTFIPSEDGAYTLTSSSGFADMVVYNSAGEDCAYPSKSGSAFNLRDLTAGETYYLCFEQTTTSTYTLSPISKTVTTDSLDSITVTETADTVEIAVACHARYTGSTYCINIDLCDAEGNTLFSTETEYRFAESDGDALVASIDKAQFAPGAAYKIKASFESLEKEDTTLRTWPTYTTETLELDKAATSAGSSYGWTYTPYVFTAAAEGDYLFSVSAEYYADLRVIAANGATLGSISNDSEAMVHLKANEKCYPVSYGSSGTVVLVTKYTGPEIVLSCDKTSAELGEDVTVSILLRENDSFGDSDYVRVTLGAPLSRTVTLWKGTARTVTYTVPDTAANGNVITFSVESVEDSDGNPVTANYTLKPATVTADDHTPCDINGDATIDLLDVVRFMKYLANPSATAYNANSLDVNGDGNTNATDLVRLTRYVSGTILSVH